MFIYLAVTLASHEQQCYLNNKTKTGEECIELNTLPTIE